MAAAFLRTHGIDLDAEMSKIQHQVTDAISTILPSRPHTQAMDRILNVSLPNTPPGSRWDIHLASSAAAASEANPDSSSASISIFQIVEHSTDSLPVISGDQSTHLDAQGALLTPSLCHPHVHLDKAYLLSHPKYADLQIERGDFAEAMELTGKAKAQFEHSDLTERGQRLIDESVKAGVTHMRAFVELDAGVGKKCLDAGLELKRKAEEEGRCVVQLCAFAQLPLFSASQGDPEGKVIRELMTHAAQAEGVDVVGSTPYVEADRIKMEENVAWLIDLAIKHRKHIDFHLDYNLDTSTEPLVWHVLATSRKKHWTSYNADRTIMLGHCTRLTLFPSSEWQRLKTDIGRLPVNFVGLPTSDLFMMRAENKTRGTLDVPTLIKEYGINACIGINNIGNAFTPHGSCDPLTLACNGVGVYQAGTKRDAEILYQCISTRAREAIGLGRGRTVAEKQDKTNAEGVTKDEDEEEPEADMSLEIKPGDSDLLLFGAEKEDWRTRSSVAEAVYLYDHCRGRKAFLGGRATA